MCRIVLPLVAIISLLSSPLFSQDIPWRIFRKALVETERNNCIAKHNATVCDKHMSYLFDKEDEFNSFTKNLSGDKIDNGQLQKEVNACIAPLNYEYYIFCIEATRERVTDALQGRSLLPPLKE